MSAPSNPPPARVPLLPQPVFSISVRTLPGWIFSGLLIIGALIAWIGGWSFEPALPLSLASLLALAALFIVGATLFGARQLVVFPTAIQENSLLSRDRLDLEAITQVGLRIATWNLHVHRSLVFWGADLQTLLVLDAGYYRRKDLKRIVAVLQELRPQIVIQPDLGNYLRQ